MLDSKYCYVLVSKLNGNLLLEDSKLPIYWNKKIAQDRLASFPKHELKRIVLEELMLIIGKNGQEQEG